MKFPPGYNQDSSDGEVLRLRKGLYGLKQAGRIWNIRFVSVLKDIGFTQSAADTQVLYLRRGKSIFYITLHVDDGILATNDEDLRKEVLAKLHQHFLVKDLGPLTHYLGLRVQQTDDEVKISQDGYIDKILARFNMLEAKEADTPAAAGAILSKTDCPQPGTEAASEMKDKPYRQMIGSLMYAYCGSRPDIGAILTKLASFCNNPGVPHWIAGKRVLRYLKGCKTEGLTYTGKLQKDQKVTITAYCDSDWAQCPDDRKSTTGYAVYLEGGPIAWQCRKQPTVAHSSTEAEFVALTEATKDVLWLTYLLTELGVPYHTPQIFTDSQSAMEWTKNASHHQRNKHVALKYFFIRDIVTEGTVKIAYIATKDNVADILTKNTTRAVFQRLKFQLMGAKQVARRAVAAAIKYLGKGVHRNIPRHSNFERER